MYGCPRCSQERGGGGGASSPTLRRRRWEACDQQMAGLSQSQRKRVDELGPLTPAGPPWQQSNAHFPRSSCLFSSACRAMARYGQVRGAVRRALSSRAACHTCHRNRRNAVIV